MRTKLIITILLWATAAILAGWLLLGKQEPNTIQLNLGAIPEISKEKIIGGAKNISASTMLLGAKFTGRDINSGRTWSLNAEKAGRSGVLGDDTVFLTTVTATLGGGGKDINFSAASGRYNSKNDFLSLDGNVRVVGYGLVLKTPKLTGNLKEQNLNAGPVVTITGQFGEWDGKFTAGGLTIAGAGPIIKLTGGVKGRFTPKLKGVSK